MRARLSAAALFVALLTTAACLDLTGVSGFKIVDCNDTSCVDGGTDGGDASSGAPKEGDLCTSAASCGHSLGLDCVTLTVPVSSGSAASNPGICLVECNSTTDCAKNYSCVSLSGSGGVRSCARNCDPSAKPEQQECADGLTCAFASTTVTVCASSGAVGQGDSCEGDDLACEAGYVCDRRGTSAICRRYCTTDGPKVGCDPGTSCQHLAEWPVSFDTTNYGVCVSN